MNQHPHIEYLLEGNFEDAENRGWNGAGWYFWDEADGQYCYGPYSTYTVAYEELNKYAKTL